MSTKKKILITAGIGTAAVVAGVAPAIASATNMQSSNITVNPGTTNPDNPGNPDISNPNDVTNLATIPTNDEFVYSIDNFNVLPNVLVDQYLQNLFAKENFFDEYKSSFTNSGEYTNVAITYIKNSVNEMNKTFELLATPINGKVWSDNTNESKTITVNIKNIETADSVAPDKNTVISYNREIDGTFLKTNEDLNSFLDKLFSEDQSAYFSDFKNVKFDYILQSADLVNRTFKMVVSPLDKHNWTNKDQFGSFGNPIIYTVKLSNFVILNVNDAEAPKQNTIPFFNALVDGTNVKSDKDLNDQIKSLFISDQSSNFVDSQGKQVFKNVKVSFYENSAKLQDKTFKVQVSLKDGHSWSDSSNGLPNSFDIQVKINNFVIVGLRDSLSPKSVASFTKPVLATNFNNNADLNNYLTNAFKTDQLSNLVATATDYTFRNVSVSYVTNSADLKTWSFKVKVVPISGHAWNDGTKNEVILTVVFINFINREKVLPLPQAFNSDIVYNSNYDWSIGYYLNWSNINKFLNPNFTIGRFITNRQAWYDEALAYQKYLPDQLIKSYSRYNPNVEVASYELGTISSDEFRGLATRYTINAQVRPKNGFFWADGTNENKTIPLSFFSANTWNGSSWFGQTNNVSDANNLIENNWNGKTPTNTWVSNKIFNTTVFDTTIKYGSTNRTLNMGECRELIIKHARADLQESFPDYYVVKMSEPEPTRSGDKYSPWKFRVALSKTLDGKTDRVEFDGFVFLSK